MCGGSSPHRSVQPGAQPQHSPSDVRLQFHILSPMGILNTFYYRPAPVAQNKLFTGQKGVRWSRTVRSDLARWSQPVRGDLARWSRPVRGDLARWSWPVSCPRCEHATTSQAPQAPLHVRSRVWAHQLWAKIIHMEDCSPKIPCVGLMWRCTIGLALKRLILNNYFELYCITHNGTLLKQQYLISYLSINSIQIL